MQIILMFAPHWSVLLLVFGLNTYKTVEMSINQYKTNTIEKTDANLYLSEINSYKKKSGKTIKSIEICTDSHCDTAQGENALTVKYAFEPLMEYISGREFTVKYIADNQYRIQFENNDWKEYDSSKQLVFDGETMYLCVY